MGLCLNIASFVYFDKQFPEKDKFNTIGKIISIKEEKEYFDKYVIKVIHNEKYIKTKGTKLIIYVDKEKEFFPGDVVNIKGDFSKPEVRRNYKGFDYRKYLKQEKIYGIIKTANIVKIGESSDFYTLIENIRLKILNRINQLYEKEYAEFLNGLLIGQTDGLSEEMQENFRNSSISHVLAISGMHVSYVILGMKFLLEKIIPHKKIRNYLLIILLILFSILTGSSVSCIRACIMFSMILLASNLYRKNNFYISFIYSFCFIILLNPYNIYNTGMWLSYFGTLGIVLFYKFFISVLNHKINLNKINKFYKIIIENFCVTLSAQILIIPIMIYVFNTVSLTFFISNILISFIIGPVLIGGYISIIISYFIFPISKIIVIFEELIIYIILLISEICAKLPFSKIYISTPSFASVIAYYLIIFFILYVFKIRKFYMIKLVISHEFLIIEMKKHLKYIISSFFRFQKSIFILLLLIIVFNISRIYFQKLEINFVDVSQGDCTFIQTPLGKNIIIDGGEGNTDKYDYGEKVLLPYLLDKGILKIDYLIVSHADSDHIGGLFAVLNNIKVNKIIIGTQPEISEQFKDLVNIANQKNIEIIILKAKDKFKIEKNIEIEVLWPIENELIQENALNNNSLVFKITYNDFSILFTGDMEKIAEKEISNLYNEIILEADILKLAHHGSKTSTIKEFLEKVNPKICLIGVGKDNKFGHPNTEVLNRIKEIRCRSL